MMSQQYIKCNLKTNAHYKNCIFFNFCFFSRVEKRKNNLITSQRNLSTSRLNTAYLENYDVNFVCGVSQPGSGANWGTNTWLLSIQFSGRAPPSISIWGSDGKPRHGQGTPLSEAEAVC